MDAPPFFHIFAETHVSAANLPHWRQDGVLYFVTFRLADPLPAEKIHSMRLERETWLRSHPQPLTPEQEKEHGELFGSRAHHWLDSGHGDCLLAKPGVRHIVEGALCHFDGERCELGCFVVAANHVHALVRPLIGHELSDILQAWKSYTARKINTAPGRGGPVLAERKLRPHRAQCFSSVAHRALH
ncbi:MAG: transposase [Chthoniobacterales bacterium]|nr:transposase [Chthoniobacterales bacterium]